MLPEMTYFNCHLQNKIISFLSSLAERKEYPMDKRDFNAADILTAVQTINHHVKDLQKLERYAITTIRNFIFPER